MRLGRKMHFARHDYSWGQIRLASGGDILSQKKTGRGTPCRKGQGASPGAAIGVPACTASTANTILVNALLISEARAHLLLAKNIPAGGMTAKGDDL